MFLLDGSPSVSVLHLYFLFSRVKWSGITAFNTRELGQEVRPGKSSGIEEIEEGIHETQCFVAVVRACVLDLRHSSRNDDLIPGFQNPSSWIDLSSPAFHRIAGEFFCPSGKTIIRDFPVIPGAQDERSRLCNGASGAEHRMSRIAWVTVING